MRPLGRAGAVLVVALAACATRYPLPCTYVSSDPDAELEPHGECAARAGAAVMLAESHVRRMSFRTDGLAEAFVDGRWFYVRPSGAMLPVLTYDGGPDSFSEGLVRSPRDGKVAYVDAAFAEVIPPKYDWGWPFRDGRALVCLGCRQGERDADGHVPVVDGRWGFIDREGREVVPVRLSREEASAR